jgi:hypothetical protein
MSVKRIFRIASLFALLIAFATPSFAVWTVSYLHPTGSTFSLAYSVDNGQQVGIARDATGNNHAALWSGTAESLVDLGPGVARATSGGRQVGYRYTATGASAYLWSDTAASRLDLTPAGRTWSEGYGVDGGWQCGFVSVSYYDHAGIWNGTAASWVDLHPTGYVHSYATSMSDGVQVGYARSNYDHAGLWRGSAASWVDLNPSGSLYSYAGGVSVGQQVGYSYINNRTCASLWSGTPGSWVNLNPAGSTESWAQGVSRGWQCGYASVGGGRQAGLWTGTAASWLDLSSYLAPNYGTSEARGIQVTGCDIWVVGDAINRTTGITEAVMWHGTGIVPEPSSLLALGSGVLGLAGLIRKRR